MYTAFVNCFASTDSASADSENACLVGQYQVADMEKALDASSGATPARSIVEALADKFTNSSERNGREVQWKQVRFILT